MAESRQITCINKSDRDSLYERITHVGGGALLGGWRLTSDEAIDAIAHGEKFHVGSGDEAVNVRVDERDGQKYLTTAPDDSKKNNLLSLPEC